MDLEFLKKREEELGQTLKTLEQQFQIVRGHLGEVAYLICEIEKKQNAVDSEDAKEVE